MAYRIKSQWHNSKRNRASPKTLEDNAGAIAYIAWRLTLEGAKKLHGEGFNYLSDRERIGVISEFLAFLLQASDRIAYGQLSDEDRKYFINAFAHHLADQMQDNLTDIAGPGNYIGPFIELLNNRMGHYSSLSFDDEGPGYDFYRYFGDNVLQIMGKDQTNRWVIDQIMDVDAPEVFKKLDKSLNDLFREEMP